MHVAPRIVLAKWFSSGLPVHQVHKCTKYTSARAKTGRISGNSGRHMWTGAHLGRFWTPRAIEIEIEIEIEIVLWYISTFSAF